MSEKTAVTPAELRAFVVDHVARTTGLPAGEVDPAQPISALGVDSVHAIDLVVACERFLGRPVPDDLLWRALSIDAMVEQLTVPNPGSRG